MNPVTVCCKVVKKIKAGNRVLEWDSRIDFAIAKARNNKLTKGDRGEKAVFWAQSHPTNICMVKSSPPILHNVILFGNRIFKEVTKIK